MNNDEFYLNTITRAKDDFLLFRVLIHNKTWQVGWWVAEISDQLQQFCFDIENKRKPKLIIQAPAQHGKSEAVVDFIAWLSGRNPDLRTIYTSYSERLGVRANLRLQRIFDSTTYRHIFGDVICSKSGGASAELQQRSRELLEFLKGDGYFRNTTVRGAITGESLDLGIIDDAVKNREEANSITIRDKTWDWYTDDFSTRFSEYGALLIIMTRWHVDDLVGRILKYDTDKTIKLLSYPAIAVKDEKHRKQGEPLFPQFKSLAFLLERKKIMGANFEALYQQNPIIKDSELIKGSWFGACTVQPAFKSVFVSADCANKTAEHNDYTVFMVCGIGYDKRLYIIDIIRGKYRSTQLFETAKNIWTKYKSAYGRKLRHFLIEDKASGTSLIQSLQDVLRLPIKAVSPVKDKLTRLLDVQGYIENGYVVLPETACWKQDFINECECFTANNSHMHDDQIDALTQGINHVFNRKTSILDVL